MSGYSIGLLIEIPKNKKALLYFMNLQILFMGSSDYSSIILNTLTSLFHVKLIATQPDKPIGRGKKIEPATLKVLAE